MQPVLVYPVLFFSIDRDTRRCVCTQQGVDFFYSFYVVRLITLVMFSLSIS
jgi:hypothetical protein